ncbi:hypothetical protein [Ideonella paludis]|uniref:Uncharacterized protein n=1 Tax=Ideonella paludis TaxID=1233411 RepID=A0ABS5DYT2_9BURK|nr:hypothetical protein [Ideonella paludis]MBQ0936305.1 hypothetical protein [Ideonella paludis]
MEYAAAAVADQIMRSNVLPEAVVRGALDELCGDEAGLKATSDQLRNEIEVGLGIRIEHSTNAVFDAVLQASAHKEWQLRQAALAQSTVGFRLMRRPSSVHLTNQQVSRCIEFGTAQQSALST